MGIIAFCDVSSHIWCAFYPIINGTRQLYQFSFNGPHFNRRFSVSDSIDNTSCDELLRVILMGLVDSVNIVYWWPWSPGKDLKTHLTSRTCSVVAGLFRALGHCWVHATIIPPHCYALHCVHMGARAAVLGPRACVRRGLASFTARPGRVPPSAQTRTCVEAPLAPSVLLHAICRWYRLAEVTRSRYVTDSELIR